METAIKKAKEYGVVIVLKGHKTLVTFAGKSYINTTGNAGLAKGGSGDALTGIITSFLAQGYEPFNAAKQGVYIHGLAADIALKHQSMESMLITDVIECLGKAFEHLMK
ncbi:MAG: ADP/ATP-dependent (S)-NAD(P)H-hydrate dehydratase, partial [Bacteroidia bacterium]